jgi:hypothetical protein
MEAGLHHGGCTTGAAPRGLRHGLGSGTSLPANECIWVSWSNGERMPS